MDDYERGYSHGQRDAREALEERFARLEKANSEMFVDAEMKRLAAKALRAAAEAVWDVAVRKGCLFATDPTTGSDTLVGFFVPAHVANALGDSIAGLAADEGEGT